MTLLTRNLLGIAAAVLFVSATLAAVAHEPEDSSPAAFRIVSPRRGQAVKGNVVRVAVRARSTAPVPVQRVEAVIDVDPPDLGELSPPEAKPLGASLSSNFYGVPPGGHLVSVYEVDFARRRIGPVVSMAIDVKGPSIRMVVPKSVYAEGEPIPVRFDGHHVSLQFAGGGPNAGHIDLLVNAERPPAGTALEDSPNVVRVSATAMVLPPMPRGFHRVWAFYTDARHRTRDPLVADLLELTVR